MLVEKIKRMNIFWYILKSNFDFLGVKKGSCILDVGCGNGDQVYGLIKFGYKSYGIDVEFKEGVHRPELEKNKIIKLIDIGSASRASLDSGDVYGWPTFDDKIDVIVSRAVIEHVRNLGEFVLASKEAIGNKNGLCLHYYPSKYSVIEPHTGVPFGAILNNKSWFIVMCKARLCFKAFRNKGASAYDYMKNYTTFRTQKEIDNEFLKHGFVKVACLQVLACHPNKLAKTLNKFPLVKILFEIFRTRVVAYRLSE